MSRHSYWRQIIAAFLLLVSSSALANEFLSVQEAFRLQVEVQGGKVEARWDISPGYYLYRERLSLEVADGSLQLGQLEFPKKGVIEDDATFGRQEVYYGNAVLLAALPASATGSVDVIVRYQGCADSGLCYPPASEKVQVKIPRENDALDSAVDTAPADGSGETSGVQTDSASTYTADGLAQRLQSTHSAWVLFIFFVLGLGLTFTPCVLPMVPILSGIIVGQRERLSPRRAFALSLAYVLGMATTYTLAGVAVASLGARANLQAWMQQPLVLSVFALLFVLLALSMFGLFELRLPAALRERLDKLSRRQKGGQALGVAIMGALSALIVSPCVSAPLAGALMYVSSTGDLVLGGAALFALAMGMGVPLLLIGTFGSHLLPRAGAWMDRVKWVFGVMLLVVALWLIERVIPTSVSLALWGLICVGCGLQLRALSASTTGWQASVQSLAVASLVWGIFLLAGAAQGQGTLAHPLAGLSINAAITSSQNESTDASFNRITTTEELESALSSAQPIMLYFYADWCISCLVMEKEIFSQPEVQDLRQQIRFVKMDVTDFNPDHQQLLDTLGLVGPPAVIFYDATGKEIREARLVGEISLEDFVSRVNSQVKPNI